MEEIIRHMLNTRECKEVIFRPFYRAAGVKQKPVLGGWLIDLLQNNPKAKPGQKMFVKTLLKANRRDTAYLNLLGCHSKVFYEGKELKCKFHDENGDCYEIEVSKAQKELVVECVLADEEAKLELVISTVYYRKMEAKDYMLHMRMISPYGKHETEGIAVSSAYSPSVEYHQVSWSYPMVGAGHVVDFKQRYGKEKGKIAYALSKCKQEGTIEFESQNKLFVSVNGIPRKKVKSVTLKPEDWLLIKCVRTEESWGFSWREAGNVLELPAVESKEEFLGKFLLTGSFGESGSVLNAYGPERELRWNKPYFNAENHRCFWQLDVENCYIRPYLDTSFYGQWFYALLVCIYGALKASEFLGKGDLTEYCLNSIKVLSDYYEYMQYDSSLFGESTFLQRGMTLDNLDSIGAMGIGLAERYQRTGDDATLTVLLTLADAAMRNIPRFDDGTYHREDTMWADDTFMSIPFLVRMWEIRGEKRYLEECFRQMRGYYQRLYIKDQHIFSHIYFLKLNKPNEIPWGRGNGWVYLTLSDLLFKIAGSSEIKEYQEELIFLQKLYFEFTEGLINYQDEEGMLHQVIDDKTSYQETSCTAMFVIGLCYGVLCKILESKYLDYAKKAMDAILRKAVTSEGIIKGVCRGSSCSMERRYYKELGTVEDDDHGTGLVLLAMVLLKQAESRDSRDL